MTKVLVVNNDFDTMSLLKSWLERKSYKVKYTSDGEEVLTLMKEFKPDLVLVDILQQRVIEDLKNNNTTSAVPVLLMTGYTITITSQKVISDDVIEKPFNLKLLEKKIERLLMAS